MDSELPIPLPKARIEDYCRRKGIRKLSLFGSVLRNDFGPQSDVDVMAEFEPGVQYGWEYFSLGDELEEIWGRKVDFHTPQDFRPSRRNEILAHTRKVYER